MANALYTYASIVDLNRSSEELKQKRSTGYVPVYEPIPTNDARIIIDQVASRYVTDGICLSDIIILCRENSATQLDHCGEEGVPICICGCDKNGRKSKIYCGNYFIDCFNLSEVARVCEKYAEYPQIQLFAIDRHKSIIEDTTKVAGFFIRRPLAYDRFITMREGGEIKAWDD